MTSETSAPSARSLPDDDTAVSEDSPFLRVQLAAERRAIALLARADVRAALEAQTEVWRDGTPDRLTETYDRLPASIAEVAFMVALEVVADDPRRPQVVEISAAAHRWGGLDVPGGRWGINNPDTLYFAIAIEAGSSYMVTGRRQGRGPVDTNFSMQVRDIWATLGNVGRRDLTLGADDTYRVTIDDTSPGGRRNHLQIQPGGTVLIVRQTLGDWTARPDVLAVERTAGPAPLPPRSDDDLARELVERLADVVRHNIHTLQAPIFRQPANTIRQPGAPGDKSGYLVTQRSTLGHFRLLDDGDALVAVFRPGGAGYAAFTATSTWGITPDAERHANSLNNLQAEPDADGTYTLVIANRDPGVAHWIDPGGLREGILMLRWQLLDEHPDAGGSPSITLRPVRLADLDAELPAGTRRVDAAGRRAQAEARAAAYPTRFRHR